MTIALMVMGVVVSVGCQAVKVERLKLSVLKKAGELPGVVYYEPEPYLRVIRTPVTNKNTGEVTGYETKADIVYLPNKQKPYAINSDTTGGQNTLELTLKNGWMLDSLKGTSDPQIDEGLKAVAEVVKAVLPESKDAGKQKDVRVKIYLMHISVAADGTITLGDVEDFVIPE